MHIMNEPHHHTGWRTLDSESYRNIEHLLDAEFNILFARQVADGKIEGLVYVDNAEAPECCMVHHPYCMLLVAGKPSPDFNLALKDFMLNNESDTALWLQVAENWHGVISDLLGDDLKNFDSCQKLEYQLKNNVLRAMRLNFRFDKEKYLELPPVPVPDGFQLREIDREAFNRFDGEVVAKHFWDSAEDFIRGGKGFVLTEGNKMASASFSAFMVDEYLELGIETMEAYRQRGLAEIVCRALIDYAVEKELEPVWSCSKDNFGSLRLAERLGFEISLEIPYYGLRKA